MLLPNTYFLDMYSLNHYLWKQGRDLLRHNSLKEFDSLEWEMLGSAFVLQNCLKLPIFQSQQKV